MSALLSMLRPDFLLHHALYGSVVVGFVCPLVGVYFVLRRLIFWGVALPQVSAAGIAFAFMLQGFGFTLFAGGESGEKHLAILGSVIFTVGAILALTYLDQRSQGLSEGRVGTLYALASAAAILFVAWNAQGETEMLSLLKGEIVTISEADFHAMLNILLAVCAALFIFQREFLLVSYDRDMAVTLGRSVAFWDGLLYLLIGVTISLGVMTVGPLVIFGLLVVPPMIALTWAKGMRSLSVAASAAGGVSAFGGFYFSYRYDLPLGPLIVGSLCALFALSTLARLVVPQRGR
ncbi:MAG: metal ABC transporter permease [Elusimicrobia bacterium]|nr:metal ABC transporter permease [Elusimicrobiota bacterium]